MTTYVIRNGELVEKSQAEPLETIHYISDHMDALRHMADGRIYDSKHAFRRATKDNHCQEVGDQRDFGRERKFIPKLDKRQRRDDIGRAIYQLKNGQR